LVQDCIRNKARRLIGRAGLRPQDREDLEQELFLKTFRRLSSCGPKKAQSPAFVATLVGHLGANLLRDRRAGKRRARIRSLASVVASADGPTELAAALGPREYDDRRGRHPRGDEDLARLAADVRAVLAALPDDLRAVAERLMRQSIAEAARDLGVARTTLYEKIRRRLRRFERAGLKDCLESFPSSRSCAG